MQLDTAILVGLLFAVGLYLLFQRGFTRMLFGFLIVSNAANLLVLSMSGRPDGGSAPVVVKGAVAMVDPLPQELILTAIVIGFGVAAYVVFLMYRLFLEHGSSNAAVLYDQPEDEEEEDDT